MKPLTIRIKVLVQVTQKDIDEGRRYNCKYCPLALALRRYLPVTVIPLVGPEEVSFQRRGEPGVFGIFDTASLPMYAKFFEQDFDNRRELSPFKFVIWIPARVFAQPGAPREFANLSTKDGLLYRNGKILVLRDADYLANSLGMLFAENLVNYLTRYQRHRSIKIT